MQFTSGPQKKDFVKDHPGLAKSMGVDKTEAKFPDKTPPGGGGGNAPTKGNVPTKGVNPFQTGRAGAIARRLKKGK